uniref:Uncharacterized protein n=1 Tax=Arundo donax TaxID=35708 RepID=A0A0A8XVE4_ARUDO
MPRSQGPSRVAEQVDGAGVPRAGSGRRRCVGCSGTPHGDEVGGARVAGLVCPRPRAVASPH